MALRQDDKKHLEGSERAMPLWLCNIKKERVSTNSFLCHLNLKNLYSVLRCNRLRWFGHVIFVFAIITLLNAFVHVWTRAQRACNKDNFTRKCKKQTTGKDWVQVNHNMDVYGSLPGRSSWRTGDRNLIENLLKISYQKNALVSVSLPFQIQWNRS